MGAIAGPAMPKQELLRLKHQAKPRLGFGWDPNSKLVSGPMVPLLFRRWQEEW
jgi:hypothetical protein